MRPHKRLEVWKEGMKLVKLIYEVVKQFPSDEKFGLTSQLKRASISVPSNIAEGAGRRTDKEFLHFLYISRGSLSEIDTQIELAFDLELINKEDLDLVVTKANKVNALLNGLIRSVSS